MTKLCARGKAAAKRKFKVYPSAYANAYASKICAGKAKDPSGVRRKDWGPKKMQSGGSAGSGAASSSGVRRLKMSKKLKTEKAFIGKYISKMGDTIKSVVGKKKTATATPGAPNVSDNVNQGKFSPLIKKAMQDGILKTANKGKIINKPKKQNKKMPKARDMAMGNKNIVYVGDPFIVDGKKFDPAKKFPKTYMRPEGAKTYSKGSIIDHAKTHRPRMTTETDQEYKKRTEYNGSYIKSEIGGKKVSNKSYENYYKDLL